MAGSPAEAPPPPSSPTVFLSYASEDRQTAQVLRDALPSLGLEVWYDESALTGGDAWDQKIRRQIRECDFFMPLISAQTESRPEGYFRREWRLAVERTLDMADDHPFLLPVVIDDTTQAAARVPERFLTVQWTRVPGGHPTAALEALCRRLAAGEPLTAAAPRASTAERSERRRATPAAATYPPFPREEPGQKTRFWLRVVGWALQSLWVAFKRLPRWVRILIYVWIAIAVMARACTAPDRPSRHVSSDDERKIKQIADTYRGSLNKGDVAKLGAQIAREFSDQAGAAPAGHSALLAIPFSTHGRDPAAQKLADASFAQTYGTISVSRHGHVGLEDEPLDSLDAASAAERGRARHSSYVLYGGIEAQTAPPQLLVRIVAVSDSSVWWSAAYPVTGTDPAKIAADVAAKVQSLEDE